MVAPPPAAPSGKRLRDIPFSVLDLAPVTAGKAPGDALRQSLALARAVEAAGYLRHWFAEHHNMAHIASSATAVLIGYVAGGTRHIRVGSGGVMLPNHAPLIIAEQFGTLDALYPGRIDLGLGRAPGTDQLTSMALRRRLQGSVDDFPRDVMELRQYLGPRMPDARVRAIPGEGSRVPVWLLGSSTYSAQLAAALGLPFAFASHFAPTQLEAALRLYREGFEPSDQLSAPYAMACVNAIAAGSGEEAARLATSFYRLALGIVRDRREPLQPPVDSMEGLWAPYEEAAVRQMMRYTFVGTPREIGRELQAFLDHTGVDEIMLATHIYDPADRIRSYQLLSPLFRHREDE